MSDINASATTGTQDGTGAPTTTLDAGSQNGTTTTLDAGSNTSASLALVIPPADHAEAKTLFSSLTEKLAGVEHALVESIKAELAKLGDLVKLS